VSEEKVSTMLPRRCAKPPVANQAVERKMREIHARLDAMETKQRRSLDAGDVSDTKRKKREVEEDVANNSLEEHLLKAVVKLGAKEKIVIPMYEGNLDVE
jgi:DNA-directed RNA polymerase specialized sigma subunit